MLTYTGGSIAFDGSTTADLSVHDFHVRVGESVRIGVDDVIFSGAGDDKLLGIGDDDFNGGFGDDQFTGGAGSDRHVSGSGDEFLVSVGCGRAGPPDIRVRLSQ